MDCDGSDQTIVDNESCSILSATLTQDPFDLDWGTNVYAKVIAINIKGESIASDAGNGGSILKAPDAPISVANIPAETSATAITLLWADAAENGGSSVIDYRVKYNNGDGTDNFVTLESNIVAQTYTANSLSTGITYKFQI